MKRAITTIVTICLKCPYCKEMVRDHDGSPELEPLHIVGPIKCKYCQINFSIPAWVYKYSD